MIDEQIIQALECCTSDKCLECPLKNIPKVSGCMALMTSALKLINRQKADIESFKKAIKVLEIMNDQQKSEEERLLQKLQQPQADTVKVFAEKLNKKLFPLGMTSDGNYSINAKAVKVAIDKIKNEMVGDNDEMSKL